MKRYLVASEMGLILLDENRHAIAKLEFPERERAKNFLDASSGVVSEPQLTWIRENMSRKEEVGVTTLLAEPQLVQGFRTAGINSEPTTEEEQRENKKNQIDLLVESGLARSKEEAEDALRGVSLEISNLRIKEMSSNPDLQAMESVQALDEIDKTANIISSRLREWYGLHFPEITSIVDDNISLAKLIINFKSRSNFEADLLEQMGYSKAKSRAIETAAKESRGADLRDEDLSRIIQLAEEAQHLFSLRDKLASHVEKTMRQVAPNVTDIAGATIGARLIARSGGLRKLAILPASTIQILGAEKALYRALKSGARPPKHGILFQHASVHSAPKWQRGKVARSVAAKIAIAARVDTFRGSRDESILVSLQTRLDEIREKYKEAPKERPAEFVPRQRRFFDESMGRNKREKNRFGRKRGRDDRGPRKQSHDRR
ncbi:MAG: NOP5/NOP56 family protein [Nitrososphaerales archaeon]